MLFLDFLMFFYHRIFGTDKTLNPYTYIQDICTQKHTENIKFIFEKENDFHFCYLLKSLHAFSSLQEHNIYLLSNENMLHGVI